MFYAERIEANLNPCTPSPCGPNSECRVVDLRPVCSCVQNYIGRSPNCRPECMVNSDCSKNLACINEKCVNPCIGSCGPNSDCHVLNHASRCTCLSGYTGDPFSGCYEIPPLCKTLSIKKIVIFF